MNRPNDYGISSHVCNNFHDTIEFIGKRWMGVIIYTLMSGPKRFHEITERIPGISDRLLTERLNELIKEDLVTKKQLEASSTIVGYELTDSGMELKEVITAIRNWMEKRTNL